MDPMFYSPAGLFVTGDLMENYFMREGVFETIEEGNDFLSQYDSDTRHYIMTHAGDIRSKADIVECVRKLREG